MIFLLIILCVFIVIIWEQRTQGDEIKSYNSAVKDWDTVIKHAGGYHISRLTGEKLGRGYADNGDAIYYGLSSKTVVCNVTEYQILQKRLKAKQENCSSILFYNNKYFYNINVETGTRTIIVERKRKGSDKIGTIEKPNEYINCKYWRRPVITNRKYFVSDILGVNSPYEIEVG
jgi:hypothetical protein